MREPVISVRNLSKVYRVYERPVDRLWELIARRRRHRAFAALTDVDFEVGAGEGVGIIGENGAGKSTLLKILAGITEPTRGEARVRGKVASILELGSGFHPELTGRQNIVLNAAMLGLGEAELHDRLPEIIAFSELGEFIDQPVKCYSSGMAMRLGFSIATQVDPEVLIIDEALSVGDGYFQKKCMDRLLAMTAAGTTLLFCSHAMYYVTAFCGRALWLRNGRIEAAGAVDHVVRQYENFLHLKNRPATENPLEEASESARAERAEAGPARIVSVELSRGKHYRHRDPWELTVEWHSDDPAVAFHVGVGVNRIDEVEVLAFGTHLDGLAPASGATHYRAILEVPEFPVLKGSFTLYVFLLDEEGLHIYDREILPGAFDVGTDGYRFGLFETPHHWQITGAPGTPLTPSIAPPATTASVADQEIPSCPRPL